MAFIEAGTPVAQRYARTRRNLDAVTEKVNEGLAGIRDRTREIAAAALRTSGYAESADQIFLTQPKPGTRRPGSVPAGGVK